MTINVNTLNLEETVQFEHDGFWISESEKTITVPTEVRDANSSLDDVAMHETEVLHEVANEYSTTAARFTALADLYTRSAEQHTRFSDRYRNAAQSIYEITEEGMRN